MTMIAARTAVIRNWFDKRIDRSMEPRLDSGPGVEPGWRSTDRKCPDRASRSCRVVPICNDTHKPSPVYNWHGFPSPRSTRGQGRSVCSWTRQGSVLTFLARGHGQAHGIHQYLQVVPSILLRAGSAQEVGRMIGDNGCNSLIAIPLAAQFPHAQRGTEQVLDRHPAQQADELGPDDVDLAFEVGQAVRRLFA